MNSDYVEVWLPGFEPIIEEETMDKLIKKDKGKIDKMMNDLIKKDKPRDKKLEKMKKGKC